MYDLVIRGAQVVTPNGGLMPLDLAVEEGKIAALGRPLPETACRTVNAEGCIVLPGVIDLHTHLRSPRGEAGLFTGETASAVAGGVTTLGDFAYPPRHPVRAGV